MNERALPWVDFYAALPPALDEKALEAEWRAAVAAIDRKIIVLDDDPTGVQTVHGVPVYTGWEAAALDAVMGEESKLVYILTNSRALTAYATAALHRALARGLADAARRAGRELLLVSRSDSTLRGHYPLETACLCEELGGSGVFAGEIIIPAFFEGGRYTCRDIHYVNDGDIVVPAGRTEFARDATFGYAASDLREWVAEKTKGAYPAAEVISISLDSLRAGDIAAVAAALGQARNFAKIIVNAADYADLKVFVIALSRAMAGGQRFLLRTAASVVRVLGGLDAKPLLKGSDLYPAGRTASPGLVIVGSHVKKTTAQVERLRELPNLAMIKLDVIRASDPLRAAAAAAEAVAAVDAAFTAGRDVCLYTSREYHQADALPGGGENNLRFAVRVSETLVAVVRGLKTRPGFLVAKGGITSSDIGVKGLGVRRAMVMGQIQPGVPVWELGAESRFPGLPYVIFPGNVGREDSLKTVVEILRS